MNTVYAVEVPTTVSVPELVKQVNEYILSKMSGAVLERADYYEAAERLAHGFILSVQAEVKPVEAPAPEGVTPPATPEAAPPEATHSAHSAKPDSAHSAKKEEEEEEPHKRKRW